MREARVSVVDSRHTSDMTEDPADVLERAVDRIHRVARSSPDIILLSEMFCNCPGCSEKDAYAQSAQTVPGQISDELAALAKQYGFYIAFGLLRREAERIFNSLVLLDRDGTHVWTHDKTTPMVMEMEQLGICPGTTPAAFDCDFGRIGGAICFDINFVELAQAYLRQGVELLLFSSAFPGGRLLDSWAIRYGFAVAASTWHYGNRIIDCTGNTVARTSDAAPYCTAVLNLNRRLVHMDGNMDRMERMVSRYGGDVLVDCLRDEAVCVITGLRSGLEVSDLISEFGIETLPAYFDRSRRVREKHGGIGWHA